jgi:ribonuclease J
MQNPPEQVDVLIMEGTNLPAAGSVLKPAPTEEDLEEQFTSLLKECQGRVFVSWSSTNIDRTVTLYKACINSGRVLVPDLYCMSVLMRLGEFGKIPQPEWKCGHMRAVVTSKMSRLMKQRLGEQNIVEYLKKYNAAMSAKALATDPARWVIMARGSLLDGYAAKGVIPNAQDVWVWSMWKGYLEQESSQAMCEFFAPCRKEYIHSSGHASPDVLRTFAEAMQPKMLIPVHGEALSNNGSSFQNIYIVRDGTWLTL